MNRQGIVFVVAAPSGAGKSSLVNALLQQDPRLSLSISYTTRPMRPGDIDGVQYHFVDNRVFEKMIATDQFFEHALVFNHQYGTARSSIFTVLDQGQDVIMEIDWQGAKAVRQALSNVCSIFILPPSMEALQLRLEQRGQDSPAVIKERLCGAQAEIAHYQEFDYLVVNEDFNQALQQMSQIIAVARLSRQQQQHKHAALLDHLLQNV